jgi:hypothetical protein
MATYIIGTTLVVVPPKAGLYTTQIHFLFSPNAPLIPQLEMRYTLNFINIQRRTTNDKT